MIAARWGMLLLAALAMLGAIEAMGAAAEPLPPSAQRVVVTSVVGLLCPLFWPGIAATTARTVWRIVVGSAAAAGLAVVLLWLGGHPARPSVPLVAAATMLMVIMLVAHAAVAALEMRWRGLPGDAQAAPEIAGRTVAIGLALLGSLPLWLGPTAEAVSRRHPWVIDAVIGASPLTHLAVASGNDLLRNPWLYQHSNLATLQFSYPGLGELAGSYAVLVSLLALAALALRRQRGPTARSSTHFDMENIR